MLNSNAVYSSIIFANYIGSKKVRKIKSENTFEAKLLQKHLHETNRLISKADSTKPYHRRYHSIIYILDTRFATVRTKFNFFPYRSIGALAESSVTGK